MRKAYDEITKLYGEIAAYKIAVGKARKRIDELEAVMLINLSTPVPRTTTELFSGRNTCSSTNRIRFQTEVDLTTPIETPTKRVRLNTTVAGLSNESTLTVDLLRRPRLKTPSTKAANVLIKIPTKGKGKGKELDFSF
ncbi:hypothetical protein MFIFM68171_03620 [Madurella fahalii]|uniref:Uncharacterized protein n=1 Tax=Madurella fahalii TaxID=1157608 RepID=A0ABQ0G756_9PEZI